MEMNGKAKAEGTFANPEVPEAVTTAVTDYLETHGKAYPWDIINAVSTSEDVPKKTARKAIRKLRMSNNLVPAEPFIGEMTLASS